MYLKSCDRNVSKNVIVVFCRKREGLALNTPLYSLDRINRINYGRTSVGYNMSYAVRVV